MIDVEEIEPLLRPWHRNDTEALRDACRASPDLQTQFGDAGPDTLVRAREFIEHSLVFNETRRNWAVVVNGLAVGNIGLSAIEWRHQTAWASYWLTPGVRGRGLASRGMVAATDWAFGEGIYRLELGHRVDNHASCRVADRAGFLPEGIERQKLRYGDTRYDVELHARLASDPRPDVVPLQLVL